MSITATDKTVTRQVDITDLEMRAVNGKIQFVGYAVIWDALSVDLGGFRERFSKGSFTKVLSTSPDVWLFVNHNRNSILARTSSKTLEIREDAKGLRVFAELAPTSLGKDMEILLKRGDISQMSLLFHVAKDEIINDTNNETIRTIFEVDELAEVSIVVFPAYKATTAEARSVAGVEVIDAAGQVNAENLRAVAQKIASEGLELTSQEVRTVVDAEDASGVEDEASKSAALPTREELQLRHRILEMVSRV